MLTEASVSPRRPTLLSVELEVLSFELYGLKTKNSQLKTVKGGGLAQLARAPALQAGGHRFDSDILHKLIS